MFKLMGKKIFTFYAENLCLFKPVDITIHLTHFNLDEGGDMIKALHLFSRKRFNKCESEIQFQK